MVSWKIALVVIVITILVVAIGMWFGYQYVLEQDEPSPEGSREPHETPNLCRNTLFLSLLVSRENRCGNVIYSKHHSIPLYVFKKRRDKYEMYQICVMAGLGAKPCV